MSGRLKINEGGMNLNESFTPNKIVNTTNSNFATLQCNSNQLIRNTSLAKLHKSNSLISLNMYSPARTLYSRGSSKINTSLRHLSKEIKGNVNVSNTDFYDKQILLLKKEKKNFLSKTSSLLQRELTPNNNDNGYNSYSISHCNNNNNGQRKYHHGKNINSNLLLQVANCNTNSFLRVNSHSQMAEFKNTISNKTKRNYINY